MANIKGGETMPMKVKVFWEKEPKNLEYNVTTPVIGIYVDFILFASAICVSKRLGSD